jgi:hypothetical protein
MNFCPELLFFLQVWLAGVEKQKAVHSVCAIAVASAVMSRELAV